MRTSTLTRTTKETDVSLTLTLNAAQEGIIDTGIAFLDHMLTLLAFHGRMNLDIKATGDYDVDSHHVIEDVAIVLGEALKEALGDKRGIERYASLHAPMDESLSRIALDISGRSMFVFEYTPVRETIGGFALENVREFFQAFSNNAGLTLHISVLYGLNDHHKVESIFKGLGRALYVATSINNDTLPSTKGVLQ